MKFELPQQIANISKYFAIQQIPSSAEVSEGIVERIRVLRAGDRPGEIVVTMKKVTGQRASLQVRSLNGKAARGLARSIGSREPDLMARAGLIMQVLAHAERRPHTVPIDRYCDPKHLETQRRLLEEEAKNLTALGMTAEGQAIFRKISLMSEHPAAGVFLKREPAIALTGRSHEGGVKVAPGSDFWAEFRGNLGAHLESSRLSQTDLDIEVGLYRGHLSHLKCGSSNKLPTDSQIVTLAKKLNILPSDLHADFSRLDEAAIDDGGMRAELSDPDMSADSEIELDQPVEDGLATAPDAAPETVAAPESDPVPGLVEGIILKPVRGLVLENLTFVARMNDSTERLRVSIEGGISTPFAEKLLGLIAEQA